ncbi:MAG: DUF3598 family protein [Cyanobacteriota bacterium]
MIPEPFSRRDTLLRHNAGTWQGSFIRLDASGQERERFASSLLVEQRGSLIVASLTNGSTGTVRTMEFEEPPPEMQVDPAGHWSLGPERIGPWPWVSELCLVQGDRRRRMVVRHGSDTIESVVFVSEGRPGCADAPPTYPHRSTAVQTAGGDGDQAVWLLEHTATNRVELQLMARRRFGMAQQVTLRWQPAGSDWLEIRRSHAASGMLEPLSPVQPT